MVTELHTPVQAAQWLHGRVRGVLQTDSRRVGVGDGFIAWPGAARDGRQFVPGALAQGALACLVERSGAEAYGFADEHIAAYTGLKAASGPIAAAYYEQPSQQLDVLAVTGTNGKTSTSWWLAQALGALQPAVACGLIGTLGVGRVPAPGSADASAIVSTGLTTPDPVLLQQTLRRFVDEGLTACAIEASSIGISERRLDGTRIRTAIFTNFTQDHLDYHGSMEAYWQAKAELFDWPGLRAAVINLDDPKGVELAATLAARALDLWTVSLQADAGARLVAQDIRMGARGVQFMVCEGEARVPLTTQTLGDYNVSNLLGVIATLRTLGVPLVDAVLACHELQPVPGRMEFQGGVDLPLAVVDYAHTPDALAQVLQTLKPLATQRGGRLWCVFGCGGDRDPHKRPLMGAAATQHADHIVLTNDNPRSEAPEAIVAQIRPGLVGHGAVQIELDRAQAIALALGQADARDVVLVAGKGHEDYQETAGVRLPFSDRQQVGLALQARRTGVSS
ncbi:UDP-N-acetylmuramoyl-L-alanyl-D-glutamate--2,6-diaminopimelate ligase [Curvibacter sp. PAE-UM]|uniref:UDP-N-acetylmuramoyl-L-alanyl-D-glutamate--2, 6-diaminopimelate ligase n=1 Tax=Curvibacter sp. PAE-UM TaxID=1714344 RepID=UPI000709DD39|nr:UDP-N-acetylmuramoyl-L-alanyl-D-glutamate--2,6-diaminopimelate ligase [Curvibacter sp. PAE-UM]KRI01691.1 UDP-N-acetylmuramoylalanyl-D-glutamate--2,6-diaminopimelate ligase [Curvibacter sp. PAE-UM]